MASYATVADLLIVMWLHIDTYYCRRVCNKVPVGSTLFLE